MTGRGREGRESAEGAEGPENTESTEVRAYSGRPVGSIDLNAVRRGEVGPDDLRIHPDVLERQAIVAAEHGNPQLAANLRRAAELTRISDTDVMRVYEALRPHRSTADELTALAAWLAASGCPLNATLVREARDVYARRGLLKPAQAP
ncbi:propanediol dehydratase small subunit [Thermocatellispora tengchongensis]|uniref:Propanediol dehydratase small subunit n=1 Tax=Thermocatellispora tengchongensis TaxID=1073253 RepID=A0A840P268_9ACTN|nr:diol dehydratase small subunit [Thermocatellispora tengchongensis]MBB5131560.1 propanediol dehydratase small subunit [Thermocatellispora tengchongensis]